MKNAFEEISPGFFAASAFTPLLRQMKLDCLEAIFAFKAGDALIKANLASWRHRIRFQLPDGRFAYLKRYDGPPAGLQVKNWIQHGMVAFMSDYDRGPTEELAGADVAVPETLAYGGQRQGLFEKRSFIISLEIPDGISLEKQLPACFSSDDRHTAKEKKAFIRQTADFVRRFHGTGYRHRDLYLAHLFLSGGQSLYLIDLHRCFRPRWLGKRYRLKDLAQLHYSCPADRISQTDRIRFFLNYQQHDTLTNSDKAMIRKIQQKARRMARHDQKHGRTAPFENTTAKGALSR
jgi:hypothetical protein